MLQNNRSKVPGVLSNWKAEKYPQNLIRIIPAKGG
jgi:hypothetical protein